jgi:hypothetical protein
MGKWLNLTCDCSCGLLVPNLATHILVPFALANSESLNLGTNQFASSIPEQLFSLVNLGAYEKGWACVFCCIIRAALMFVSPVNLDLHENEITGTVSTAFGLLTNLGTYLAVGIPRLGLVPFSWSFFI